MSAQPALAALELIDDDALPDETDPVVLHFAPILRRLRGDDFFRFCQANDRWRLELSKEGDLIIMMAAGSNTGRRNAKLTTLFGIWAAEDGTGEYFDSSAGFTLPNGAERSPDLSWVKKERWEALSQKQREKFAPLCPDFVVELRSGTDRLKPLQAKLEEYIENGAQLGWLIDPYKRKVYVYRPGTPVERFDEPETISGEPLLPGFVLPVAQLWQR
ncbi:MAG: Uma2 family endonuclease [Acidobacteria bacterium]|nr:Uma2 family endonuclease [Acidobacteriota bacterium]MBI3425901.1 Uma2 family endonuclease [Acidobacteriota bacterium]